MKPFVVLLVASVSCTLFACSAAGPDPIAEEAVEQSEEALTACGAAKYSEALGHYKNAVAWSKDRNAHGVCNSDNGFQWAIADEASRAVMTCGEFRSVIKTSPWAAPLRQALAPSLTLRSLSGELLVIKDSAHQNWTGAERFFTAGLSFWARAEGAYGSRVRIDFRAGGKATYGYLDYNEVTGDITWKSVPATYTIGKSTSREAGPRTVTVTRAGKVEKFELGVDNALEYSAAPIFVLEPLGAAATTAPKLYSLVSECDA